MPMIFFATALAIVQPQKPAAFAVAQATATIRVVEGVRLKLDGSQNADAPPPRASSIKMTDGSSRPARLIEFQ